MSYESRLLTCRLYLLPLFIPFALCYSGKLCLQHEDIAKKCVAAMARELEICPHPSIRNNVVIVMCDLCVRSVKDEGRKKELLMVLFAFGGPVSRKRN